MQRRINLIANAQAKARQKETKKVRARDAVAKSSLMSAMLR